MRHQAQPRRMVFAHGGHAKNIIVSYSDAFHGRTLGAQQAGGIPSLKEWIGNLDPGFVQVPFPDGFRTPDTSFDYFERCLHERDVDPQNVAAVLMETYQGASAAFAPNEYMRALRQWCDQHNALLVLDEVQAGFGRTGTMWGFEHYGIVPDLALFGKGISSSLPLAAVAGSAEIMDSQPIGTMTSTHTGNPVCCAAALASIDLVVSEKLAANACQMGNVIAPAAARDSEPVSKDRRGTRPRPGSRPRLRQGPAQPRPMRIWRLKSCGTVSSRAC